MLELRLGTWEQFKLNTYSNYPEWGDSINIEHYWERERVSKDCVTGHRPWILVDSEQPDEILASCESYTQESPYCLKGTNEIKYGLSESIASVFVEPKHRNKGYATKLMKLIYDRFKNQDKRIFCELYSDINPIVYEKCGWIQNPPTTLKINLNDNTTVSKFLNSINNNDNQFEFINENNSKPVTESNIELVLKKGIEHTEKTLIEIANHNETNSSIEYVFSKQFTKSEFYWEISQAKLYSTIIEGFEAPTVFGHCILNKKVDELKDFNDVKSFIVWTFDYREKCLKILKLFADSELDFKFLLKKSYDQALKSNLQSILAWWPKSSNDKFKKEFVDSINQEIIIRDGSIPMVTSWINLNGNNNNNNNSSTDINKGIWINVEKFGWV
ncbi:hypothetical protein DDB_G0292012 [Dictyostelium discoideum AX4]|uniref:N-acetyltransferase domain-containing protein n=1 Tax=Dictyostelium discoideum TaxID=44689 RepID=Q54DV6_DICDI|nr:hypothetical protein DDB_G0292012 [Dictyostelium discoideum AX4]EAL61362.1 hypothetical protein DDB_G0292012 [Dictyostelium discoideum AX4]|eukprot:XP_629766.1 hypothetical protein DDB_G0292012 [Dictyostelium discoideum AX4]